MIQKHIRYKVWDIIFVPSKFIYKTEDKNVRPCLIIGIIGNNLICLEFTKQPSPYHMKVNELSYLKFSYIFTVARNNMEIYKSKKTDFTTLKEMDNFDLLANAIKIQFNIIFKEIL